MTNTIIESIKSDIGYNLGGISSILLLDKNQFWGYEFTNEIYKHELKSFVRVAHAKMEYASRKRFVVFFKTKQAQYFTFNSDGGVQLSHYTKRCCIKSRNTQYIRVTEASNTNSITDGPDSSSFSMLFVVSSNGTKVENLPQIKIENSTTSTDYIENKDDLKIDGWQVPYLEDYMQLLGMIGKDLSPSNIMKYLFVSPNDIDLPWLSSFNISNNCEDLLGARLIPCGHKRNDTLENGAKIFQFGERMALGLNSDQEIMPVIYFNMSLGNKVASVVYDNEYNIYIQDGSIKAWQRNYRFCRRLTDDELGYRLWIDKANDKILVTNLTDRQPADTTELEKGLLRGLAVRWMNEDNTKVLASLSKLQAEIEKTKNGGGYDWYGFYE